MRSADRRGPSACTVEPVPFDDPRFGDLLDEAECDGPSIPEARRSIVVVEVERVGDSCGYECR